MDPQFDANPAPALHRFGRRVPIALIAFMAAAGVLLLLGVGVVTRAAFVDTTDNGSNTFQSGDVVLTDDDQDVALFTVPAMAPGATVTRCIRVSYTGSLGADVRLYSAVGGNGLAQFLDTTVLIGTGGNAASCNGFTPTSTLFTGTLAAFGTSHTGYTDGLQGFDGATDPTARTYQVSVTLRDNQAAQNLSGSLDLIWEAQNN